MDVNYYDHARASRCELARAPFKRGFTLLELLVTIAVIGVLLVVTVPSFADLIGDTRLISTINTMSATLHFARSEAVKRVRDVVICKGTSASACESSSAWDEGWIVFVDENRNRQWDSDTEPLLREQPSLRHDNTITLRAFPTANDFTYHPSGLAGSNGTFTFCDARGDRAARALIISKTGRPRTSRTAADGSPLKC